MRLLQSGLDWLTLPGSNEIKFTLSYITPLPYENYQVSLQSTVWILNPTRQVNNTVVKIPKLLRQEREQITELSLVIDTVLKSASQAGQDNTCSLQVSCHKAPLVTVLKCIPKTETRIIKHALKGYKGARFPSSCDCNILATWLTWAESRYFVHAERCDANADTQNQLYIAECTIIDN